jgi:type II secretory pathway component GspD/PulD (secretin)
MKAAPIFQLTALLLTAGMLCAQTVPDSGIEPVANDPSIPGVSPSENSIPSIPDPPNDVPPPPPSEVVPPATAATDSAVPPAPTAPFGPLEQQKQEMQKSDEGFIIKDAALNDIFQFLAKSAGRQYFHNSKIAGPDYLVTGHLNDGNPLQQMEELAFMYGLSLHTKGNTIYALTQAQLAQLPSAEFHYQLRYLRPTDMEQIKELIKPMLSPGTGIVNFEPKTNTIIIIDSANRIEQAQRLLHGIDKAKGQIIVETKIMRINSNAAQRMGVNWESSLGSRGIPLSVARDLGSIFGLPFNLTSVPSDGRAPSGEFPSNANLVLGAAQATGLLRALAEGGLATQVSNPTLITEDNEQATISIIDRVPIITSTTTASARGAATVTEEVRYKIDISDKTIDTDPDKHREIGISLVVTPTLLPDGTVRMKMRPRSAQIVENVQSVTGNFYPRVTESMVESIARVPDGYSLIVGGFYGEAKSNGKTKVPLLGDIPVLNFFFKSKESLKEQNSLVFVVTPRSYNPSSGAANNCATSSVRRSTSLDCDHDWVDEDNPGPAHEANLRRTVRSMQPTEAPYYPRAEELERPAPAPARTQTHFSKGSRR